jgi:hypothetical protein
MELFYKKSIFLALILLAALTSLQAQVLRNDMVSALGGSYQLKDSRLTVHQSIGQSSVIGVFTNSPSTLVQGFLRGIQPIVKELEKPFDVIPFPNSFTRAISFRFLENHQDKTSFIIYDINGKEVFNDTRTPFDNEVQLSLDYLATGIYITIIRSGNRMIQKRIIKKE